MKNKVAKKVYQVKIAHDPQSVESATLPSTWTWVGDWPRCCHGNFMGSDGGVSFAWMVAWEEGEGQIGLQEKGLVCYHHVHDLLHALTCYMH